MRISTVEAEPSAFAESVRVTNDRLVVALRDGREISVPLSWYPRLSHGEPQEHQNWELIGRGMGIHWPDLDEDISIQNLVLGQPSSESQESFRRWLEKRNGS